MNDNLQNSRLTSDERKTCEDKAAAGLRPHSQRATALLMLDTGATVEEAATQSGLTPNQVKFWSGRFRTNRLAIFSNTALQASPRSNVVTKSVTTKAKPKTSSEQEKDERKKDKKTKNKSSKQKDKKAKNKPGKKKGKNAKNKSGKKKDKNAKNKSGKKKDKKNKKSKK